MSTHYSPTHTRTQVLHHPARRRVSGPRRLVMLRSILLALAFVALGVRLFFIQVVDHAHYAKLSVDQVRVNLTTTALRAGIYDRNGQILAVSRPTSLVIADDMQIKHPAARGAGDVAAHPDAGESTGAAPLEVQGRLRHLERQAQPERRAQARRPWTFPGIVVQNSSVRTYPNGPLATSVLGGTNAAGAGSAGLEYQYQKLLAGQHRHHARVRLLLRRQSAEFVQHGDPQGPARCRARTDARHLAAVRGRARPRSTTRRDRRGLGRRGRDGREDRRDPRRRVARQHQVAPRASWGPTPSGDGASECRASNRP